MINTGKTEYMALNCPEDQNLTVGPEGLKQVDDFCYLGSMVASSINDFKRHKELA